MKLLILFFFGICAYGRDWNIFFELKCDRISRPDLIASCPRYTWNPEIGCVPWDIDRCNLVALSTDFNCGILDCTVSIFTKEC